MFGFRFLLHVVGRLVNAPVEDEEDDESGPVVADDEGRIEDGVLEELDGAFARSEVSESDEMLPAEDGDEEEQGRNDPRDGDHPQEFGLCAPAAVLGRYFDRTEPVDGDEEDGVLRNEADGVVDGEPEVAQDRAQVPVAHNDVDGVERHGDGPDEDVSGGQRSDKVIAGLADGPLDDERQQDEDVASYGEDDANAQADDDANALPHFERHWHLAGRRCGRRRRAVATGRHPVGPVDAHPVGAGRTVDDYIAAKRQRQIPVGVLWYAFVVQVVERLAPIAGRPSTRRRPFRRSIWRRRGRVVETEKLVAFALVLCQHSFLALSFLDSSLFPKNTKRKSTRKQKEDKKTSWEDDDSDSRDLFGKARALCWLNQHLSEVDWSSLVTTYPSNRQEFVWCSWILACGCYCITSDRAGGTQRVMSIDTGVSLRFLA